MAKLLDRLRKSLAGRYRVERQLDEGGMAHVYLAEDLKNPRRVAIKVLKPEIAAAIGGRRFVREIEIAAGLNHPYILPLLDSGAADDLLYYVMPFVEGESLRDRLNREKQLSLEDAVAIAGDVGEALDHAHRRDIVHRDIKPENILLSEGHALVTDFGIARAIHAAGGTTTETGMVVGTPGYMSPEQVSGRELDGRSDVFSLGCVFYEMLMGDRPPAVPFEDPQGKGKPRPSAALANAVRRALGEAPGNRFATAGEFCRALKQRAGIPRWVMAASATAVLAVIVVALAVPGLRDRVADLFNGGGTGSPQTPERVLLAEFDGPPDDPLLAVAIRELVRVALDQSAIVRPVPSDQVQYALQLAGKPETTRVNVEVARELAYRHAIQTVVEGRVLRLGEGLSLVLRLVDAETGDQVISISESAKHEDDLIPTVGKLTRHLRKALGEKERDVRASRFLWEVATPSFEAYRKLYKALELNMATKDQECIVWAREALKLDPEFPGAWRQVGVSYLNLGKPDSAQMAWKEAVRHGDRSTDFFRVLDEAAMAHLSGDVRGALSGYDRLVREHPNDPTGQNNRAYLLKDLGFFEEASEGYQKAIENNVVAPNPRFIWNQMENFLILLRLEEAKRVAERLGGFHQSAARLEIAVAADHWTLAESLAVAAERNPSSEAVLKAGAAVVRAGTDAARGAIGLAAQALLRAETAALSAGSALWVQQARRLKMLLNVLTDLDSPNTIGGLPDSTIASLVTEGMARASNGDLIGARRSLDLVRAAPALNLAQHGPAPALLESWIAHHSGQWEQVIRLLAPLTRDGGEVGRLIPVDGPGRPLARWLVADAYARMGAPDSAAIYFELALSPERLYWEERLQRAVLFSYAHQRLVLLYAQMGRLPDAQRHLEIFAQVFTRPDAKLRALIDEARAAVEQQPAKVSMVMP